MSVIGRVCVRVRCDSVCVCALHEAVFQKEQQNHLKLGIFEKSKVHETHAQTCFQAPIDHLSLKVLFWSL